MSPLLIASVASLVLVILAVMVIRHRPSSRVPSDAPAVKPPELKAPSAPKVDGLGSKVRTLFGKGVSDSTWRELEDLLVRADLGPTAAADLVARVRRDFKSGQDPAQLLQADVVAVLGDDPPLHLKEGELSVVLVVGVNGAGKTTTIGKLARRLSREGKKVSLAASDTFRAAAGEQLEVWADRAGAHLVSQDRGADPGAVAFDAVKASQARGSDVLIVDTAGRLHTKTPLMDELKKVKRVIEKAGAKIGETLLVLDAQTGQNGIAQARAFTEAVDVTGVILTKMDGSAKGGIVVAVREELGVPIRFVGVGEGLDDLALFDPVAFAERLLA
ncbi:MAG: fused signal recognition particle receptor [Actinomycetota bacterium]|jgi:fused signal recognition particle receptor|nr:fused signal recognition particle receptor [Actinomycetota bacterium]